MTTNKIIKTNEKVLLDLGFRKHETFRDSYCLDIFEIRKSWEDGDISVYVGEDKSVVTMHNYELPITTFSQLKKLINALNGK